VPRTLALGPDARRGAANRAPARIAVSFSPKGEFFRVRVTGLDPIG